MNSLGLEVTSGTWELLSTDSIYIDLDNYVEGTFYLELITKDEMILSTDHNNVKFFGIGDVKAVVRCSKGEPTSQSSTTPQVYVLGACLG